MSAIADKKGRGGRGSEAATGSLGDDSRIFRTVLSKSNSKNRKRILENGRCTVLSIRPMKAIYQNLPSSMQRPLKYLYRVFFPPCSEPMMYRVALFDEMLNVTGKDYFRDSRILEIGPKDGLDSKRLASLRPVELVMVDLPEKREGNEEWLDQITCQKKYIETNFMYMPKEDYDTLGSFRLIWCTGVLYHNAEQMRMLRKLYRLLEVGGYLVLESATLRSSKSLRSGSRNISPNWNHHAFTNCRGNQGLACNGWLSRNPRLRLLSEFQ